MAIMTSPAPDTSVLDPKPHQPALEAEQKTQLNGHVSLPEKKADTPSDTPKESTAEPRQTSPAAQATEPSIASQPEPERKLEVDAEVDAKPLINGNGSPKDEDAKKDTGVINGVANSEASPSAEKAESKPEPTSEERTEETKPTVAPTEPADRKASPEESPKPASELKSEKPEDVDMVDASATAAAEPLQKDTAEGSATKPLTPSKEKEADTEMSDRPSDDAASAAKPPAVEEAPPSSEDASALPTSEVDLQPASMSQLNIDNEAATSPVQASVEVSMTDAPSSKVPREREDDADADEPAPKRAKTEPKDEEESAPTAAITTEPAEQAAATPVDSSIEAVVVAGGEFGSGETPSLENVSKWKDVEVDNQEISTYQRREMRKVIGKIKKTKGGASFKDSVEKLWPALWDSYISKIDKPMDLSTIDRNLRDAGTGYKTFGEVRKDLALIFENTLAFNGPAHDVTISAMNTIKATWEEIASIPSEEPARPKPLPKAKPVRESRTASIVEAAAKKASAGPVSSPTGDALEAKSRATPVDQAADRRASTATDVDRPKRTVRAPKPKDIDYTTKPSRKKLKPEIQFAEEVLSDLMHPKHKLLNQWFLEPVDAEGLNIPEYYSIIKKPMDLGEVSRMLSAGEFNSLKDFDKTVKLIFQNCYQFNGPVEQENPVSMTAKQLENLYLSFMKNKDAWLAKNAKAKAQASASNASEDEDEDDEDAEDDPASVDNSKEIEGLRAKLDEETKKLNDMFASGTTKSLIDIQRGIVEVVQEHLMKAAQAAADAPPKPSKGPKKSGKAGKSKAAGSQSNRKSTGGASQGKKPGPKKGTKKSLTAADKDQVASAINDLDYPHLDRAIDIIKKDTGQNENNDGELELDIDQLSTEALLKLWELCKKVLPGFGKDSAASKSSPEVNRSAPAKQAPKTAAKPKKNKPMSAQEQEARIAQLTALRDMYRENPDGADYSALTQSGLSPAEESSDDSDSEEE